MPHLLANSTQSNQFRPSPSSSESFHSGATNNDQFTSACAWRIRSAYVSLFIRVPTLGARARQKPTSKQLRVDDPGVPSLQQHDTSRLFEQHHTPHRQRNHSPAAVCSVVQTARAILAQRVPPVASRLRVSKLKEERCFLEFAVVGEQAGQSLSDVATTFRCLITAGGCGFIVPWPGGAGLVVKESARSKIAFS